MKRSARGRHTRHDFLRDLQRIKGALLLTSYHLKDNAENAMRNKSDEWEETITSYTSEHPYKTVGMSLLAGLALGFLLRH